MSLEKEELLSLRRQHADALEAYERYMKKARGSLAHAERVEAELDRRDGKKEC